MAHWLQKIFITNGCTLIRSCKLLLHGSCFSKRYCLGKPLWGVQLHSLLWHSRLEGIFSGEKSHGPQLLPTTAFRHAFNLELGNTCRLRTVNCSSWAISLDKDEKLKCPDIFSQKRIYVNQMRDQYYFSWANCYLQEETSTNKEKNTSLTCGRLKISAVSCENEKSFLHSPEKYSV